MNLDVIPIWLFFLLTCMLVVVSIDAGYRIGNAIHKRSDAEKEPPVSGISTSVLGLLAFILVFTFNTVSERFDVKKALVREDANAIRTAWLRSKFLPEPDRLKSQKLIQEYLYIRTHLPSPYESYRQKKIKTEKAIKQSTIIFSQLYDIAVLNGKKDMDSEIGSLYIQSLNEMINIQNKRVAIGWQARIPNTFWVVLYILMILSMLSVGYRTAIADSSKSWSTIILTLSFSLVITLIAILDRPQNKYIQVSQQPLLDLQEFINTEVKSNNN